MELIFAAAVCSVLVSIVLKICKTRGYDVLQMISCNYAAASVLTYLWFQPDVQQLSLQQTPWWLIVVLAILLPSIFVALSQSLQWAGILKTELAQRLSVVWSLFAAFLLFQEHFSSLKLLGIGLGITAVLLILFGQKQSTASHTSSFKATGALLAVWLGYALIDVLLKYTTGLGVQFALALNLIFACAFIFSGSYLMLSHKHLWHRKSILAGLGLGVLNFANIALYVKAHMLFKDTPAVVFAGMNFLVVVLGVLSGVMLFKEKLKMSSAAGLVLGLVAVACLAYAM